MAAARLIILSGVSGSGKSTALDAFEDLGFFCIENLPAPLISNFVELLCNSTKDEGFGLKSQTLTEPARRRDYALAVDCRDEQSFPYVKAAMQRLEGVGVDVVLLFFDCQDEVIVRRYSETRRPHPLLMGQALVQTVTEALAKERELLGDFREAATRIIDTTGYSPHELRRVVEDYCKHQNRLEVTVMSFGYKYGIPHDADLVVDVRFLANPYFVKELRALTGMDKPVADYIFQIKLAEEFLTRYLDLLEFLIPRYREEGKSYLTVAVGCTGGRHRSVALSIRIQQELMRRDIKAKVRHRDIERN